MAATICPRCESESMDNGVCMFCGPDTQRFRDKPPTPLAKEWKGFDRDLGAKKRQEREEAKLAEKQAEAANREGMPWGAVFSGIAAVAMIGGLVWWFASGHAQPTAVRNDITSGLPTELVKPASAARGDLMLFARQLEELAVDAQRKLTENPDFTNTDIERYQARLSHLHDTGRELEPQLTREEQRVLHGLQNAEKLLGAFLRSFLGKQPELDGRRAMTAIDQIRRAQDLARGAKVDDHIVAFKKRREQDKKDLNELIKQP